jgi:hypothetical protein
MCPLQARLNAMCPENHYSGAYSIPRVIPLPTGVPLGMPAIPMGMVNMAAISTNSDLRVPAHGDVAPAGRRLRSPH